MKKSILHLILIIVLFTIGKQVNAQIPNGSFENWNSTPFDEPGNWKSGNGESLRKIGSAVVTKVTGNTGFAVRMETKASGSTIAEAYITNGDPMSGTGGIPCAQIPTALTGFYRYNLPSNDSAIVLVIFKNSGSIIGTNMYKIKGTGSQNTFASFSLPITLLTTPDSVVIAAASSNLIGGVGIEVGSFLELDGLAFAGTSVSIPNSQFENWSAMSYDVPSGWEVNGEGVSKTTDHYSGNFAVLLTTIDFGNGDISSAGITTGHQTNNGPAVGGVPFTLTADTITGYYKYITSGSDTASMYVSLSNNSSTVGSGGIFLTSASNYTYFEFPINAFSQPDTMLIDITSSRWPYTASSGGSALYIDGLALKSQTILGLSKMENKNIQQVSIFPNPVSNLINFTFEKKLIGSSRITVHDSSGRLVKDESINNSQFNVADLAPGIYYYEITNDNQIIPGKFTKK